MVHGRAGFVLAATISLLTLAPVPTAAAGVNSPAAGRDTVGGGARLGTATIQGSTGSRRRSQPALPKPAAQTAARTAPAAGRRIGLAGGIGTNVQVTT